MPTWAREQGTWRPRHRRPAARHARDAAAIWPKRRRRVSYYLFAPQGRAQSRKASPPQAENHPNPNLSTRENRTFGSRMGYPLRGPRSPAVVEGLRTPARRFDRRNETDKIEKLPWWRGREAERQEHPILENSTACTCQMPNNLVPAWPAEIPLDQSRVLRCPQRIVSNDIPLVRSNSLLQSISG